jgi:hypothetical protein
VVGTQELSPIVDFDVDVEVEYSIVVDADFEEVEAELETTWLEYPPGGMTLKETVAPHWERGVPLGQQPPSVQ